MSSSESEAEEFYDAQEFTPNKSKRSSLVHSSSTDKSSELKSVSSQPTVVVAPLPPIKDDQAIVKNVVQDRLKFRSLRQCMQTEEDEPPTTTSTPDSQSSSVEGVYAAPRHKHPFKIIEHDAMSLPSMTSLGRIGRILGGTIDSTGYPRESVSSQAVVREPSAMADELMPPPPQPVLAEPDVIASTKANSLQAARGHSATTMSGQHRPVAPPRRKKRGKLHGSQSLSAAEGDDVSVADDDYRPAGGQAARVGEPPPERPTPHAATIESLARELHNSILLASSDGARQGAVSKLKCSSSNVSERRSSAERPARSGSSSRSSTAPSVRSHNSYNINSLDIRSAIKGHYIVKASDEDKLRSGYEGGGSGGGGAGALAGTGGGSRTQSEERATPGMVGHSSLGSNHRWREEGERAEGACCPRERRRSAGDEEALARRVDRELRQLNMQLRTRTDSGKRLSDLQILEQVTVLNLDTGERVPLSIAEHKLPQCMNPLSLHIMRLTSEYISSRSNDDEHARETDEESVDQCGSGKEGGRGEGGGGGGGGRDLSPPDEQVASGMRKRTDRLKRFLGTTVKRTMVAAKTLAQEVSAARHKEYVADVLDQVHGDHNIKLKASNSHKGPYDFDSGLSHVQEMKVHAGAVWCMKFSTCGRLLATAGQDRLLRIWVLREAAGFFQEVRRKYNAEQKSSPTPSRESLASLHTPAPSPEEELPIGPMAPFCPKPFCVYTGHTSDLLDVSWSKNYFVLSSSMDKTVRLWHISRVECLCCFQHIDFVTAIAFHPRDDRYFLSGSLDGKLRLWDIPEKKVAVWNEVSGQTKLITAANFCQNGKFAVVGTYDGRCIFYTTELKYHTQIDVRSSRGKNSIGRKISGIEPMPNEDKILVTSNDSRIRLYDQRELNVSCKYKGYVNVSSQIKASFSHDGKYIVSGSENHCIYIWKTHHDYSKFTSVRRDRNDFWEGIKAHNALVTCAVFAPSPACILRAMAARQAEEDASESPDAHNTPAGYVLVSADFNGCIKVFVHKAKPKHSSLPASALA